MVTTQRKAMDAAIVLKGLAQQQMASFGAYKLFRLRKALVPVIEFQTEQEHKIVEELGGTITEAGMLQFDGSEDERKEKLKAYADKHREMDEMECEIDIKKLEMHMKEIPQISLADMMTLDEFIEWKE